MPRDMSLQRIYPWYPPSLKASVPLVSTARICTSCTAGQVVLALYPCVPDGVAVNRRPPIRERRVLLSLQGSGTDLADFGLKGLEVRKGVRALAFVAQERGRMIECSEENAALFSKLSVFAGNLEIRTDEAHGRDTAEADDDLRLDP